MRNPRFNPFMLSSVFADGDNNCFPKHSTCFFDQRSLRYCFINEAVADLKLQQQTVSIYLKERAKHF